LNYPEIIKKILLEYLKYDSADDVIKSSVSFDDEHGNYILLQGGGVGMIICKVRLSMSS